MGQAVIGCNKLFRQCCLSAYLCACTYNYIPYVIVNTVLLKKYKSTVTCVEALWNIGS